MPDNMVGFEFMRCCVVSVATIVRFADGGIKQKDTTAVVFLPTFGFQNRTEMVQYDTIIQLAVKKYAQISTKVR